METTKYFNKTQDFVTIETRCISIKKQRNIFGQPRSIDLVYNKLWITIDSIPDSIVLDENQDLLFIECLGFADNVKGSNLKNLHILSYDNYYNIKYNPGAIKDCKDLNLREFSVIYTIHLLKDNKSEEITESNTIAITMHKAEPELYVDFKYENSEDITYQSSNRVLFGKLTVTNTSPNIKYSEVLDVEVVLNDKDGRSYLGELTEIVEHNPTLTITGDDRMVSVLDCNIDIDKLKLTLRNLAPKNSITIPVYLDFAQTVNPLGDDIKALLEISYGQLNTTIRNTHQFGYNIKQDAQMSQLIVKVNDKIINNNATINLGTIKWVEFQAGTQNRFNGYTEITKLSIGNAATTCLYENSGIIVRNINISLDSESETGKSIIAAISTRERDIEKSSYRFINKPNSFGVITCELNHNDIDEMKTPRVNIEANIEFEFFVDSNAEYIDEDPIYFKKFAATIKFEVESDPGCDWLCVDYGTSATVATFGDGTTRNTTLLDLNERHDELLDTANIVPQFRKPKFENNTPFISSNVVFRKDGILKSKKYDSRLLWLSPTEPQFRSNGNMLTYIKALVGYSNLPNAELYNNITYKEIPDGPKLSMRDEQLSIEEIFTATYDSLFSDFIMPSINKIKKKANKLVLTVPNTYTPRHMEYIRRIVGKTLPDIRQDYTWFLSESDAIACYYTNKWNTLNADRQNKDMIRKNIENILIFDMGAGTLDITYFSIDSTIVDRKKIEIKAKIGLNKAGNYLDYILAKTLVDVDPAFSEIFFTPDAQAAQKDRAHRAKQFIRNELKPHLFTDDTIHFNAWGTYKANNEDFSNRPIDLSKIRSSALVTGFIKEVTHDLIDNFFKINGYLEGATPIDTIVFAGRSTLFGGTEPDGIKMNVMNSLLKWNGNSDLYDISLHDNDLKTVVSEGALYFATLYSNDATTIKIYNRNIYASYGVIYTKIDGTTGYCKLLSPNTQAIVEPNMLESNTKDGVYIYQYDTDIYNASGERNTKSELDLRNSSTAYFVQSYSDDTVRDWDEGRKDFITEMFQFNTQQVVTRPEDRRKVPVRIVVNEDGEMEFYAGNMHNEPSAPLKIDVTYSKSFINSMWPYY